MMTRERTLGPTETRLLNRLAADGQVVFSTDQARAALGDAEQNINKLLYRLTRKRWLLRLEKGKYLLLPLEAGTEGRYTVHEFVIAAHLIQPAAIAYASALHHWHMTEQLPRTVFVQSTSRKNQREKEVLGVPYRFVTVVESKFFGVIDRTLDGQPITVTDREKTLVDAADRPDLSGGIAQLAHALRVARDDVDWRRLEDYLHRWPTGSPMKRIGYLVESLELPRFDRKERLARWRRSLSAGIVDLEPGQNGRGGRIITRWGLRINVDETWRRREHSVMADRHRERTSAAERRSQAAPVADEEQLVAELDLLGIRYLSRQSSDRAAQVRPPARLLADLVQQPHARVRSAVIALLLSHPEYAEAVPAALRQLTAQDRLTLQSLYTAAVLLQREYVDRLRPLVGTRWRWLPDLLSEELGLPSVGAPREKLRLLDLEMRYRTGATVNWMGSYEAVVRTFIRDRERQALWNL